MQTVRQNRLKTSVKTGRFRSITAEQVNKWRAIEPPLSHGMVVIDLPKLVMFGRYILSSPISAFFFAPVANHFHVIAAKIGIFSSPIH
jgi:hypothetical protein